MEKIYAKLKYKAEDFIVEEIGENWKCSISSKFSGGIDLVSLEKIEKEEKRDFLWCELEKLNLDHFSAIRILCEKLGKSPRDIGYSGSKDKKARTSQRISIFNPDIEKLKNFKNKNIYLKNFKWNKRKLKIGYLKGNKFKIILRDISSKEARKIKIKKEFGNFFGSQRFGANGKNFEIGKAIFKKDFEKAVKIYLEQGSPIYVRRYLEKNPSDFLGALKRIDRKNLLMIAHSVQSKIFNEILERAIEEKIDFSNQKIILAGFRLHFSLGRLGEIEKEVLEDFGLELNDFNLIEIPFLRLKGSYRNAFCVAEDLKFQIEDDEEFEGSKKVILEFYLDSGVYATTFLENYFELNS